MPEILMATVDSVSVPDVQQQHKHHRRRHPEDLGTMKTTVVTTRDLDNNANLLVMMFNPTCSHCEEQTNRFEKVITDFHRSKLVMMTRPEMRDYLPNFVKSHHIKDYPAIIVGVDSGSFYKNAFMYSALPQINIYSPDRKLIKTFVGEVVMDSVKQYIR